MPAPHMTSRKLVAFRAASRLSPSPRPPSRQRYPRVPHVGQSWALRVPLDGADRGRRSTPHESAYGYAVPEDEVEMVNIGVSLLRRIAKPDPSAPSAPARRRVGRPPPARLVRRLAGGSLVHRYALEPGDLVSGPAVIEEPDSAVVVQPGWQAEAGPQRILRLTRS